MTFTDLPSDFMGYLPVMDVEAVHVDPRRREDRDCTPSVLWHIDDTGTAHVPYFAIEVDRLLGLHVTAAVVVNCSASGLCIVSRAVARPDDAVHITALDAASGDLLFREAYVVCGKRRADGTAAISGNAGTEPGAIRDVHRYALRLDHNGNSQVFKSFLDSVFLEHLRDQPEVDLIPLLRQMAGRGAHLHKAGRETLAGRRNLFLTTC